jgi:hypothetical protein
MRFLPVVISFPLIWAAAAAQAQLWPPVVDERSGVVATDTSGWGGPVTPMQGAQFFDALGMKWWYNYLPDSSPSRVFPGYHKLYMYWRATLTSYTPAQIQAHAAAAAAAYPGETIWWAMSNEPNDLGQANQSASAFAEIYYLHHSNLKIGDPNCRIMGPGILNWDFLSTSVWQKGKDWYEEFRQAWYDNPTWRAYSEANYGVSYPPQDAFNLHTYDLRGVQGTPWAPEDWRYSRDQMLMCYTDLQTYPETAGKKIWLTEFGALRAATMADNIILTRQLVGWMRDQSFIARWVWFTIHSDKNWSDSDPPRLELLDENGQPWPVGLVAQELATLPIDVKVDPINGHYATDPVTAYLRVGTTTASGINDVAGDHPRFELVQGASLAAGTMRGREIAAGSHRFIRKVVFQYTTNYDNSKVKMIVDGVVRSGSSSQVWEMDQYGGQNGSVELTFDTTDRIRAVATGLVVVQPFTYSYATGGWYGELKNLVIYSEPDGGMVAPDFDGDMDVDQADFGHFQACYSSPGLAPTDPTCRDALLDGDNDVDGADFAVFLRCLSGAGISPDPDCETAQ